MKILLTSVLASFIATSGFALTASENNAPGGDYADALGASTNSLGTLPVGFNDVSGVLEAANSGSDTFDAFYISVGPDTELFFADISTETGNPSLSVSLTAILLDSSGNTVFSKTFLGNTTETLIGSGDTPLSAGTYNFGLSFAAGSDLDDVYWTSTSELRTASAPVPLPAGVLLMVSALGGLRLMRSRRV